MQAGAGKLGVMEASYASAIIGVLGPVSSRGLSGTVVDQTSIRAPGHASVVDRSGQQRLLPSSLPDLMRKNVFFFVSFHRWAIQAWILFLKKVNRMVSEICCIPSIHPGD